MAAWAWSGGPRADGPPATLPLTNAHAFLAFRRPGSSDPRASGPRAAQRPDQHRGVGGRKPHRLDCLVEVTEPTGPDTLGRDCCLAASRPPARLRADTNHPGRGVNPHGPHGEDPSLFRSPRVERRIDSDGRAIGAVAMKAAPPTSPSSAPASAGRPPAGLALRGGDRHPRAGERMAGRPENRDPRASFSARAFRPEERLNEATGTPV